MIQYIRENPEEFQIAWEGFFFDVVGNPAAFNVGVLTLMYLIAKFPEVLMPLENALIEATLHFMGQIEAVNHSVQDHDAQGAFADFMARFNVWYAVYQDNFAAAFKKTAFDLLGKKAKEVDLEELGKIDAQLQDMCSNAADVMPPREAARLEAAARRLFS
jgi:hypothetical protein